MRTCERGIHMSVYALMLVKKRLVFDRIIEPKCYIKTRTFVSGAKGFSFFPLSPTAVSLIFKIFPFSNPVFFFFFLH